MNSDVSSWISEMRDVLQEPSSPLGLKNGLWHVKDRKTLWQALGSRIFDNDLERLKECAVSVLSEPDPMFELPPQERYAATVYGKEAKHSYELRKGLAESLALLGTQPSALSNCSQHKAENTAFLAVREILQDADWVLWATLGDLLPILAEASPNAFMDAVERSLQQTPCPFDELFAQEGVGITGRNYITGLLWALETLAWEEDFLVQVCVILGELANRDPGGNWGNRPANSLTTILLPWLPRTVASIEKRKAALRTLRNEVPSVAWGLLISLLPDQTQTSFPTHKPAWRTTIPDDWQEEVTNEEYWEQVSSYANLAVEMAMEDKDKLEDLTSQLDHLPEAALEQVLEHLSSNAVSSESAEHQFGLWTKLTNVARRHRRFSDTEWAWSAETISRIETVADTLAPQDPLSLHRMMFNSDALDLYEDIGDLEEQERKLEERRQQAIKDILSFGGVDAVILFAEDVESPRYAGRSLGAVAEAETDEQILPLLLETTDKRFSEFTKAYVLNRWRNLGWEWVDGLDRSSWSVSRSGQFLSYLPFEEETWNRATDWLGEYEREYWNNDALNPYINDGDMGFGVDKLIEYGRSRAALQCLGAVLSRGESLDKDRSVKALLASATSAEQFDSLSLSHISRLIKALQDDPETDPDDLVRVEWAYIYLLDSRRGTSPKTLESRLASDPDFFCEIVRFLYHSRKEDRAKREPSEQNEAIARNAWKLLHDWRLLPGIQADGSFLPDQLQAWLSRVKETCEESGHLEVAFTHIGQILFKSPPDPDGLWIHRSVAEALNYGTSDEIRNGYYLGVVNSRGVQIVDPTGKPERELAEQYRNKARQIENAGYYRFAGIFRRLAEHYDREADRIVARHADEA